MSLFGNLLTTYEMIQGASGQTPHSAEKDGDADAAKRALIPYGHTTLPVSLTVLVDANGCIRGVAKRKSTIIIPCTEESMGRTIKPVPHPLFDQLQYVDSGRSPEKTSMYLQQLAKWKGDDAKLEAVFKCVSEHSISEAAAHYGVELTDKDDKAGVCFEVQIGLEDSDLSNDVDIRNRWIAYLQRSQHRLGKDVFGEDLYTPTTNFPKKVVSSDANAKLLSANDSTNFTFRGRFSSKEQALLVDSASSQKINSTLRWLVNNHGTLTGNQAIVVWAIKRPEEKPVLNPQSGSFDFDDSFSSIADESKALHDDISDALNATNVQYAKIFSRVLRGYEGAEDLKKHNDPMVVVILDAATTGRLGVTFYCELQKDEYIKRILQWHVDAAWPLTSFRVDSSPISKEYVIMAALENKIDFAIAFEVNNANPNGDPLNGNRPRTTSEGLGEVSDVALKRKIRNRLQDAGESVFVQSDDRSDDGAKSLSDRFNTYLKTLPKDEQKQKNVVFGKVCERWLDVRSFGQVFAFKKAKDTDEVSIGVRGPVSIQPAFSINPIAIDDVQITKSVNSETTDSGKKSSDTMGMKYRVSGRAVYVTYGSISPQLAERTGFSAEDAEKIKEALVTLFENDESSARPSGSMEVLDVVWFAHNCKGGQYSSAKVHRSVSVDADGTVNVDDASIPGLRYEVIEGR